MAQFAHPHEPEPNKNEAPLLGGLQHVQCDIQLYRSDQPLFELTNFSPLAIVVHGTSWRTTEHFFQAQKFLDTDPAWARAIQAATTPLEAAGLGRNIHHPIRPDWDAVKESIMRFAVATKVLTYPALGEQLLATKNARLVLASPHDYFWGAGRSGGGLNRFGDILMELRALRQAPDWKRALEEFRSSFECFIHPQSS